MGKKTISVTDEAYISVLEHTLFSWRGCLHSFRPSGQNMPQHTDLIFSTGIISKVTWGDMESKFPELALCGRKKKCTITKTIFSPICEVSEGMVFLRPLSSNGIGNQEFHHFKRKKVYFMFGTKSVQIGPKTAVGWLLFNHFTLHCTPPFFAVRHPAYYSKNYLSLLQFQPNYVYDNDDHSLRRLGQTYSSGTSFSMR